MQILASAEHFADRHVQVWSREESRLSHRQRATLSSAPDLHMVAGKFVKSNIDHLSYFIAIHLFSFAILIRL